MSSAMRAMRRSRPSQLEPTVGELVGGPGELGVVDAVAALPTGGGAVDESDAVEHREVLGDGLAGDRQLLAQRRGGAGAVGQQEVEQPATGRIADGRPQVVVDGGRHAATSTVGGVGDEPGEEVVPALARARGTAARARRPPSPSRGSRSRSSAAGSRRRWAVSSNVTSSELPSRAVLVLGVDPAEREQPRRLGVDDRDLGDLGVGRRPVAEDELAHRTRGRRRSRPRRATTAPGARGW